MLGELSDDENIAEDEETHYRLTIFNSIMDIIISSFDQQFSELGGFYGDLECFDPRRFSEINKSVPGDSLNKICTIILSLDKKKLKEELMTFAEMWPHFSKRDLSNVYKVADDHMENEPGFISDSSESEEDININVSFKCTTKSATGAYLAFSRLYVNIIYIL
ncbi:hypothetical protein JTB14_021857 [Gonioctena quinquepunctata]|nr:hypothetical protein JTB14_021857 [Gonioctena quinquepunctata]